MCLVQWLQLPLREDVLTLDVIERIADLGVDVTAYPVVVWFRFGENGPKNQEQLVARSVSIDQNGFVEAVSDPTDQQLRSHMFRLVGTP